MLEANGANGKVTVDDRVVIISREGTTKLNKWATRQNQGYVGEKRILISTISAIQFKVPGAYGDGARKVFRSTPGLKQLNSAMGDTAGATGFIQFCFSGGSEHKGRTAFGGFNNLFKDENTVMFHSEQLAEFEAIRDFVEARIGIDQPASSPTTGPDLAGQIAALQQLHTSGALSDSEFEAAKRKLLST